MYRIILYVYIFLSLNFSIANVNSQGNTNYFLNIFKKEKGKWVWFDRINIFVS